MNRRTWTLLTSVVLVVVFGMVGAFVPVPFVALGPGPTYNTLGSDGKSPVIRVDGEKTYPTGGHLNMTTVSVTDQISMFGALGLWASGSYALAPRELYFPPGKTEKEIERENTKAFNDSQTTAESAALSYLDYPMKVLAGEIVTGTPADKALKPGDRLVAVNGKQVTTPESLQSQISGLKPGAEVEIRYQRADQGEQVKRVRLAERPHDSARGFLGVTPISRPDVDFGIEISLADVGGPSAGLMFALAIVDKLTPGKLTGGKFVAGTGEISETGKVGPIGGIPFKMVQAKQAGANAFLVPAQNCAEAKSHSSGDMQLFKVGTIEDAMTALKALRSDKPQQAPRC